jgi:ABC-type proline/glycine betaine transport system substrate-binding protein
MGFSANEIGEMAYNVDIEGMTHAESAAAYIANHRAQIDEFMR